MNCGNAQTTFPPSAHVMFWMLLTSSRFSHAWLPNRESFFRLQQTALKKVFYLLWSRSYMLVFCFNCSAIMGLQHILFAYHGLHFSASRLSMLSLCLHFFDLEMARKCNTPAEPTTQTAAERAAGGVQKRSDDELDIVPNLPSALPSPVQGSLVHCPPAGS